MCHDDFEAGSEDVGLEASVFLDKNDYVDALLALPPTKLSAIMEGATAGAGASAASAVATTAAPLLRERRRWRATPKTTCNNDCQVYRGRCNGNGGQSSATTAGSGAECATAIPPCRVEQRIMPARFSRHCAGS